MITLALRYILLDIFLSLILDFRSYSPYYSPFLFDFPFDASTSAFSTSSRISFVLKTNFPFLRSLYTYKSSLASVSSFYKSAFLEVVLSKANPDYSIYYFIGVSRIEEQTIVLTSDIASYNSIPSGSELSSRE
jgi:hypothetical protein